MHGFHEPLTDPRDGRLLGLYRYCFHDNVLGYYLV